MDKQIFAALLLTVACKFKDVDSAPCTFEFENSTGIITSDSARNYSVCSWFITAPIHHNIRLEFTTFQLTNSQVLGQNWIEIFDGKSANRLGVYVGTRRPFVVKSSGRFMLVKLIKKGTKCSPCNFKAVYTMIALTKAKPRITIPIPVVRTVPGHVMWCYAKGTPPINMSLLNSTSVLAKGESIVMSQIYQEGNYTCEAANEFGTDSRDFQITFIDCGNPSLNLGKMYKGLEKNIYFYRAAVLTDDTSKCIPTTTRILIFSSKKVQQLHAGIFSNLWELRRLIFLKNKIEHLPKGIFSNLRNLNYLFLQSSKLQYLSTGVFSNLSRLMYLQLNLNKIKHLPEGIFSSLRSLYVLDLSSNEIEHLPAGIFVKQKIIVNLYLFLLFNVC